MNSSQFLRQLREAEPEIDAIWQEEYEYDGRENTYLILSKVVNWILEPPTGDDEKARLPAIIPLFNTAYVSGDEELRNLIASEFLSELATSKSGSGIQSMLNDALRKRLAEVSR